MDAYSALYFQCEIKYLIYQLIINVRITLNSLVEFDQLKSGILEYEVLKKSIFRIIQHHSNLNFIFLFLFKYLITFALGEGHMTSSLKTPPGWKRSKGIRLSSWMWSLTFFLPLFRIIMLLTPSSLVGSVQISPSKSMMQRVLLAAHLCDKPVRILNPGFDKDSKALLVALSELGLKIQFDTSELLIVHSHRKNVGDVEISVGESGLACRMIMPYLASRIHTTILNGKGSLPTRPMDFVAEVLNKRGAKVNLTKNKFLPAEISGVIKSGDFHADGGQSSQHITGLLYALTQVEGDSVLVVDNMVSTPYIDMTLDVFKSFGVVVSREDNVFSIKGNQSFNAQEIKIEGDWSGAANWFVAAALGHEITISGVNQDSPQADKAILNAIISTGCQLNIKNDTYSIITPGKLNSFEFDATNCPDLFPPLVALAVNCTGISKIKGVDRLTHKESNRYISLQTEYAKLGIVIERKGDVMLIHGAKLIQPTEILSSWNDHRIAMSLGISCHKLNDSVELDGAESVAKSYPQFWNDLEALKVEK